MIFWVMYSLTRPNDLTYDSTLLILLHTNPRGEIVLAIDLARKIKEEKKPHTFLKVELIRPTL